jgi:hypothetical protein
MRRYLILSFALLLLIFAVQVVPATDLADGDSGVNYAILTGTAFHPPSTTKPLTFAAPQHFEAAKQPANFYWFSRDAQTESASATHLVSVMRC